MIGSGPLIFLIIITQFMVLAWSMFVAGKTGVLYFVQIVLIAVLSTSCIVLTIIETKTMSWVLAVQFIAFLCTGYVLIRFHKNNFSP